MKKINKKLNLGRETLLPLTDTELGAVNGGVSVATAVTVTLTVTVTKTFVPTINGQ